jgi:hypothetical protein
MRTVLVVAVVAGLALGASACGGSSQPSATEQWAGSVCSAFTTWKTSLENIKSNLTGGIPSSSDLKHAGQQAEDATTTLARSLKKLGAPKTTGGEAAKSNLETLETNLSDSMSTIKTTLNSNPSSVADVATAISTVSGEVAKMAGDLNTAVGNLKQFDPSGELEKGFKSAPACSAYFGR